MRNGDATGPEPAPPERVRTWQRRLLLGFLAFQLVVPATYYLRDDRYDERFSWRMFSAVRLHTCETTAEETRLTPDGPRTSPIDLARTLHVAWLDHLGRNRRAVVHAFLERRCREVGVVRVRVVNDCVTADDRALPPIEYTLDCATHRLGDPPPLDALERGPR
ncbi:MAG: hypothetical protein U0230_02865 [Polyangiales bacterium]